MDDSPQVLRKLEAAHKPLRHTEVRPNNLFAPLLLL
jgi:hypothetical protein